MTEFSKILELGDKVLNSIDDTLLELADSYNAELERLISQLSAKGTELADAERALVSELTEQHAKVVSRMEGARDVVGSKLRDVQKKAQVIRSYFDQQAPRGGVTGTKKG